MKKCRFSKPGDLGTTIFILVFLYASLISSAQKDTTINLIPNPSFEEVNTCVKYDEQCYPEAWRSSTLKAFYYLDDKKIEAATNKALDGNRFVSIGMHNSKREFDRRFLQVPLLCELKAGKTYELSFYYKTPFRMLEQFGVRFSDSIIIKKDNKHLEGVQTSINFRNKNIISPNKWIKVTGIYKAKGGEKVMTVGNFNRDANTTVLQLVKQKKGYYDPSLNRTSYLFDHFKLIALDAEINCDIEKNRAQIYADDIRHEYPKAHEENEELVKVEEIPSIEVPSAKDVIVINEDSIVIDDFFELPNILFESNSDRLLSVAYPSLKKLANYLVMNRAYQLTITGHTDNQGTSVSNQSLSKRRAKTVHDYLISEGIFKSRITFKGKGESEPIATNDTEEGRAMNRRVEFSLVRK